MELELNTEEKNKLAVQNTLSDLVRQLESTLGGIDVSSKSGGFSHLIQVIIIVDIRSFSIVLNFYWNFS